MLTERTGAVDGDATAGFVMTIGKRSARDGRAADRRVARYQCSPSDRIARRTKFLDFGRNRPDAGKISSPIRLAQSHTLLLVVGKEAEYINYMLLYSLI